MQGYKTIIASIVLAMGMLGGALFISKAMNNYTYYSRSIHVKGLSEKDVLADQGVLKLLISVKGKDLLALSQKAEEQKKIVIDAFLKAGYKAEEIKADFPISSQQLQRVSKDGQKYMNLYVLDLTIEIETSDVEKLYKSGPVINACVAQGVFFKGAIEQKFFYTQLNAIKPDMLKEASENAYKAALELADNTKSHIGKIKDASQGAFSIRLRNDTSEYGDYGYGKSSPYLRARVVTNVTYFIND